MSSIDKRTSRGETSRSRQKLTQELKRRYENGESIRTLAAEINKTYGFVHRVLVESGVKLRGRGGKTRGRNAVSYSKAEPARRRATTRAGTLPSPNQSERDEDREHISLALAALLHEASPEELAQVGRLTDPARTDELDARLWGPAPNQVETATATLANLRQRFDARRELETQSVSRGAAAELLGVSEQAVTEALASRRLLGLKHGGRWVIPAWQFDAEAERGVLPDIGRLSSTFPGGIVSLSAWVMRPSADLDGRTPRDLLSHGEGDRVMALAESLTAAGW
jgi:hypothetical protein